MSTSELSSVSIYEIIHTHFYHQICQLIASNRHIGSGFESYWISIDAYLLICHRVARASALVHIRDPRCLCHSPSLYHVSQRWWSTITGGLPSIHSLWSLSPDFVLMPSMLSVGEFRTETLERNPLAYFGVYNNTLDCFNIGTIPRNASELPSLNAVCSTWWHARSHRLGFGLGKSYKGTLFPSASTRQKLIIISWPRLT